ncbi:MAG: TfoX/Sxy family protein [Chloroflexota bacterium]
MASKGAKATSAGKDAAAATVTVLEPIGVTSRSMFGGHGIFREDVMFAIVHSDGRLFLRADTSTARAFETAGSTKHERMPYWEVPESVRTDPEQLMNWAATAADVATEAKR